MKLTRNISQQGLQLLQQILGTSDLAPKIRSLGANELYRLICRIGLEDCGTLIALVTPEQLFAVLDVDLWRSPQPGQAERFDAVRFSLWLDILFEMGTLLAAEKLSVLNRQVVVMALSTQIMVVNEYWEGGLEFEKKLEGTIFHEFPHYLVLAKEDWSWDALIGILAELEDSYPDAFEDIMQQLLSLSYEEDISSIESIAYAHLLSASDQMQSDVAEAREERRESAGFVTPVQAAEFLNIHRQHTPMQLHTLPIDPITRAYFARIYDTTLRKKTNAPTRLDKDPEQIHTLLKLHRQQQKIPIYAALEDLAMRDPQLYAMRLQEAVYLSNVLMAGCSFQSRVFKQAESVQAVNLVSNLGLDFWLTEKKQHSTTPSEYLVTHNLITLFRMGWSMLHHGVSMRFAADLEDALAHLPQRPTKVKGAPWLKKQLEKIQKDLRKGIEQNQPWQVMDQLLLLDTLLDSDVVSTIVALMSEFPLWRPPESSSIGKKQIGWIYTLAQVNAIVDFGATLPSLFESSFS